MKNNMLMILKIEVLRFLSSFNTKGQKARKMPLFYFLILIFLLFIAASFGYSFLIIGPFARGRVDPSPAVTLFAGTASLFIFMSSISQARTIYIGDDYDLLSSLPLRKRDIVTAKIVSLYLIELSFSLLVMIPHAVMLIILTGNITCFLIAILLGFTIPIVPIALAILFSLLITMATSKFKSANVFFVFFYTLLIVGLSTISVFVNRQKEAQAISSFSAIGDIIKWINPSFYFVELSLRENTLYLLIFIAINIAVIAFSILFIALLFDKLHEIVSSISMRKNYVRKELKTKSQSKVLLSLEFKRLINSKLYFVNTVMGSIMTIFATTVYLVTYTQSINSAHEEARVIMLLLAVPMFVVVASTIIGMVNPTTGCINIEGKTFWIMKSLPVDYKKYMFIKLVFAWALTLPACLIASTIGVIFLHNNAWEIVLMYITPIIYSIFNSLLGLVIAIKHPKLKWNNENEAVKNSASVLISLLVNFAIMIVLGTMMIVIPLFIHSIPYLGYLIFIAVCVIGIIPCAIYLNKRFATKISQIEDL